MIIKNEHPWLKGWKTPRASGLDFVRKSQEKEPSAKRLEGVKTARTWALASREPSASGAKVVDADGCFSRQADSYVENTRATILP